jgi:hypothetical protein
MGVAGPAPEDRCTAPATPECGSLQPFSAADQRGSLRHLGFLVLVQQLRLPLVQPDEPHSPSAHPRSCNRRRGSRVRPGELHSPSARPRSCSKQRRSRARWQRPNQERVGKMRSIGSSFSPASGRRSSADTSGVLTMGGHFDRRSRPPLACVVVWAASGCVFAWRLRPNPGPDYTIKRSNVARSLCSKSSRAGWVENPSGICWFMTTYANRQTVGLQSR